MELTDENQDYMDCRPLNPNSPCKPSPRLQKMIDERNAAKATNSPKSSPLAGRTDEG